jgi:hypothetical protein
MERPPVLGRVLPGGQEARSWLCFSAAADRRRALWTRQGQRLQIMLDRCDRSTRWAPPRGEGTTPAAAEEREPSKIRWTVGTQPADYKEKIMSDRPSTRALTLGH